MWYNMPTNADGLKRESGNIMKKVLSLLLIMMFVITLCSCDDIVITISKQTTTTQKEEPDNPLAHVHTEVIDEAVEATCTETGLTEGKHCSVCKEVLVAQTVISAKGHTEVVDEAVEATCTETGLTEGKHCSVCNKVIVKQAEVPVIPHTYDDKYDATCNVCGFERDVECAHTNIVKLEGKDATCDEAGLTAGETCADCQEILVAQKIIPAAGHTEVVDAAKDATCTETGLTEGKHCDVCGEVLVAQQEVEKTAHTMAYVTTHPTADSKGSTVATCSVCGEVVNYGEVGVMVPGTYVLEASALSEIAQYSLVDGEVKIVNGVFDCHLSYNYRTDDGQKKTFYDDYYGTSRMNFGGETTFGSEENAGLIKNGVAFTATAEVSVTIWWVAGDNGRQVALYTPDGQIVAVSSLGTLKNGHYISTLTAPAGTYVLGTDCTNAVKAGGNYFFKVEVEVGDSVDPVYADYYLIGTGIGSLSVSDWHHEISASKLGMIDEGNGTYKITIALYAGDMFRICHGLSWDGQMGFGYIEGATLVDGSESEGFVKDAEGNVVFTGIQEYSNPITAWNITCAAGQDGKYEFTLDAITSTITWKLIERLDPVVPTEGTVVYFQPTSRWDPYCEGYAVYCWNDAGGFWVMMEEIDADRSLYSATIPAGYSNVIFVGFQSLEAGIGFDNRVFETVEFVLPEDGSNLFTLVNPWDGAYEWKATGDWSVRE